MSATYANTETFIRQAVGEMGLHIREDRAFRSNLKANKPNEDNITAVNLDGLELRFAADGMPLFGVYPNSYDRAPEPYQRDMVAYERQDSPSRLKASDNGARVNQGAAEHLNDSFGNIMPVLRAMAIGERALLGSEVQPDQDLTARQSLDVLNGVIYMWSFMKFRKQGRQPNIPPELAALHRTMSGVRLSLLSLFLHDDPVHLFNTIDGWQNNDFNADNWTTAVEESGILSGPSKQICPAPTTMIRQVIRTVVEPPKPPTPKTKVADLETSYDANAETFINYGWSLFRLEQAKAIAQQIVQMAASIINDSLDNKPFVTRADVVQAKASARMLLQAHATKCTQDREQSFADAMQLLGYNK